MHLGINGQRLVGKRTGVGRYVEFLLKEWNQVDIPFDKVTVYTSQPVDWNSLGLDNRFENRVLGKAVPNLIWENLLLPRAARKDAVLFCPSYTIPVFFKGRTVMTNLGIYEGYAETFPWWHKIRFTPFFKYSATHANQIIAISASAKHDMQHFYKADPAKITVIHPAAGTIFRPAENPDEIASVREKYGVADRPYVLFVGKLSLRRNIPNLLSAFAMLKQETDLPHRLVIVGPNYLKLDVTGMIADHHLENDVLHLEFIGHPELARIYNGATAFILPSSHEGFSFTTMEALGSGTPVIALDHAALAEGIKESVYLMADSTPAKMAKALEEVLSDSELQQKLSRRGLECAANYSWRKSAERTMTILEKVAHS